MKKTLFVLLLFFFIPLSGCGDSSLGDKRKKLTSRNYCDDSTIEKRAEFILRCIKYANPLSDEEPEDWIMKCQTMAEKTFCPFSMVEVTQECVSVSIEKSCRSWRDLYFRKLDAEAQRDTSPSIEKMNDIEKGES